MGLDADRDGVDDAYDAKATTERDTDEDGDANGDGIDDRLQKLPDENTGTGTGFQSGGGSVGWLGLLLLLSACASRSRIKTGQDELFRRPPGESCGEHRVIP